MKNKFFFKIILVTSLIFSSQYLKAEYWLVIGTYRQGPGNRPEVSGITSPSLYSLPMKDLETCKIAGEKITNEIYKPVWQFDSKWTCIWSGEKY
tara:strand:- start:3575 stop:3856 length:282 start_codon:yes stop_codon:yes gene_type:complete